MSLCRAKFQPSKTESLSVFNRISTGIPVANPEIVSARSFQGFSRSRSEFSFSFRASMEGGSSGEGCPLHGRAAPSRSHQGLKARAAARSDEIVLQIDPEDGGLDQEVGGLRRQVHQLRNVAREIDKEGKFQNDMLNQLQSTLIKARAGVKNNVRRLHRSIVQYGSNNVVPIIVFALICIFLVYLWYKISG